MVTAGVAINQLLLAQCHQLATVDGVDALHRPCCGECPARPALHRDSQYISCKRINLTPQQKQHRSSNLEDPGRIWSGRHTCFWFLTSVTAPFSLQSISLTAVAFSYIKPVFTLPNWRKSDLNPTVIRQISSRDHSQTPVNILQIPL
jgi:hypothetical protein